MLSRAESLSPKAPSFSEATPNEQAAPKHPHKKPLALPRLGQIVVREVPGIACSVFNELEFKLWCSEHTAREQATWQIYLPNPDIHYVFAYGRFPEKKEMLIGELSIKKAENVENLIVLHKELAEASENAWQKSMVSKANMSFQFCEVKKLFDQTLALKLENANIDVCLDFLENATEFEPAGQFLTDDVQIAAYVEQWTLKVNRAQPNLS